MKWPWQKKREHVTFAFGYGNPIVPVRISSNGTRWVRYCDTNFILGPDGFMEPIQHTRSAERRPYWSLGEM